MKRVRWLLCLALLLVLSSCSSSPERYVENGNKYFSKGKYKEASIMYRRALQKNPKFWQAWYRLGLTNLKLGNGTEAVRNLLRATDASELPENLDAFVALGNVYLYAYIQDARKYSHFLLPDHGELQEHVVNFLNPKSFDALRFRAFIKLFDKKTKESVELFKQANQLAPDQPEVILWMAQALLADNQPDPAVTYLRQLIAKHKTDFRAYNILYAFYARNNRPELAEQVLKDKIANNPGQGQFVVDLARHYSVAKRSGDMNATLARLISDPKTYPNAHVLVGDFYVGIRDFDGAIQQYEQGAKDPKQKADCLKRMAAVLKVQRKNDQAMKIVADLIKENPKDPEAIAMHADLLLESRDPSKTKIIISELEPLVAKTPSNPGLHYDLGRAYMLAGDPVKARLQLEEAVKETDHKDDRTNVAVNAAAKVPLAELELLRGEYSKAVQLSQEILAVDVGNLPAALMLAAGHMKMNEYEKARQELTAILKVLPGSIEAHFQMGQLNLKEKRFKEAEDEFNILKNGNDPRGLIWLIQAKIGEKDFDGALSMVRDQLRRTPDNLGYQVVLANTEYQASKWADAANDFQKLIDNNPKAKPGEIAALYIRLGETKRYAGDLKGAAAAFQKAHEIAPNDIGPMLQLAMLYDTSGRSEDARKAYEDVLKLKPDDPVALNNVAYAKADDGVDLDQALTYAQRAQQKLPNNTDVMDTLSLIYIRKNMTDESIRLLRELVSQHPERATYHLHLAMAYYQKGNRPDARKELEAAARYKPSEKEQARIKEMKAKVG